MLSRTYVMYFAEIGYHIGKRLFIRGWFVVFFCSVVKPIFNDHYFFFSAIRYANNLGTARDHFHDPDHSVLERNYTKNILTRSSYYAIKDHSSTVGKFNQWHLSHHGRGFISRFQRPAPRLNDSCITHKIEFSSCTITTTDDRPLGWPRHYNRTRFCNWCRNASWRWQIHINTFLGHTPWASRDSMTEKRWPRLSQTIFKCICSGFWCTWIEHSLPVWSMIQHLCCIPSYFKEVYQPKVIQNFMGFTSIS